MCAHIELDFIHDWAACRTSPVLCVCVVCVCEWVCSVCVCVCV